MTPERLAEIRARHEWRKSACYPRDSHRDIEMLLAEVERLRAKAQLADEIQPYIARLAALFRFDDNSIVPQWLARHRALTEGTENTVVTVVVPKVDGSVRTVEVGK